MNLSLREIQMPQKAAYIIDILEKAGFEAYVVGGCVRDSLLGKEPMDWDITTSAKPEEVKGLFPHTIDTGIAHGTVTILLQKEGFEVTTYRIDGKYEDGRHPTEVTFTPSLREDLRRRDFTINAMAYNHRAGLVDLFHGLEDLEKGIIRCVGEPMERFSEDALRMMRGVRFAAQLGYEIDDETFKAMKKLAPSLRKISAERIQTELVKLMVSDHPDHIRLAYEAGLTEVFFPEFDSMMRQPQVHKHHLYNVGEHTLVALRHTPKERVLRLAVLLHDVGKPETLTVDEKGVTHFYGHPAKGKELARTILKRLKFDNDTINLVCKLVHFHDFSTGVQATPKNARRMLHKIGEEAFPYLLDIAYADICAQSEYKREEKLANLALWRELYQEIRKNQYCVSLKSLAVNGDDLKALGIPAGKEIGEILNKLLDLVIENPAKNEKQTLLEIVKKNHLHR